jgi:sialate O-acetylesterase
MQFPLRKMTGAREAIGLATNSNVRFINIYKFNFKPYECDNCIGQWTECSPESVPELTAVGYCFMREISEKLKVPVGLIEADFGGTKVESWMKAGVLKKYKNMQKVIEEFEKYKNNKSFALIKAREKKDWFNKLKKYDKGFYEGWMFPAYNTKSWKKINLPVGWDKTSSDLSNFHGSVWLRKTIVIPENWKNKTLIVNPGAINGQDIVWLNGNIAGRTLIFGLGHHQRNYEIKSLQFHAGTNSIVIWNYCSKYDGGLRGPAKSIRIYPSGEKEKAIPLAGTWSYKKGYTGNNLPKPPLSMHLCYKSPVVLYNSMIAPLIPYAIKGVLWYQGESNVRSASNYRELFTEMIKSWRSEWNQGDFPFYFVQIAPFKYSYRGNLSAGFLREAQLLSLNLTNTGMAVTLDVGNPNNIHPEDKTTVGHRLALWALAKDYGFTNLVFSGPLYKNYKIAGNKIILSFNYAEGLKTSDGKSPSNFEIAGADKKFFSATAKITGDKITVSSEKVEKPVAVRFGWSDIAEPNLCNSAGLPASSFRTDNWKQ